MTDTLSTADSCTTDFGPLTIEYQPGVLVPRTWTRLQSGWASRLLPGLPEGPVLELCCGAGHIGLLAVHGHERTLVAVDANPAACELTRRNAAANGIAVEVRQGDLGEVVASGERFPLIIADPPWVPRSEVGRFPEDPVLAIDGGDDGLDLARACIRVIGAHLAPGGCALLQVGSDEQVDALADSLAAADLRALDRLAYERRGVVVRLARD